MIRYSIILLFVAHLFGQDNGNEFEARSLVGFTNFINLDNTIKPFLNDSSNYGQHQKLSFGFGINNGFPSRIYSYSNTVYYKLNNGLIADANYTLSNVSGSQYTDKYGYQLLNDVNGDFDAGLRYYPFNNSFFNIDARTYNSPNGNGASIDLDFMGLTIKRFIKKGYIDDSFSIIR
tara:strand:- start:716 stop:1243 length:528 start_codon:yes stop_codon:yes gene_type:complete